MFNLMTIVLDSLKSKTNVCVSGIGFQFHTPGTKENIKSEKNSQVENQV